MVQTIIFGIRVRFMGCKPVWKGEKVCRHVVERVGGKKRQGFNHGHIHPKGMRDIPKMMCLGKATKA